MLGGRRKLGIVHQHRAQAVVRAGIVRRNCECPGIGSLPAGPVAADVMDSAELDPIIQPRPGGVRGRALWL
jgi:hypothetical protein